MPHFLSRKLDCPSYKDGLSGRTPTHSSSQYECVWGGGDRSVFRARQDLLTPVMPTAIHRACWRYKY